ncbi:MAG: S-methyl-5'-thioinosine phosphorylase [Proteobacteria bacterium]|nr:S-methyl-5'-thioinosine phosphorylase [Pseudomonadota bacterium]
MRPVAIICGSGDLQLPGVSGKRIGGIDTPYGPASAPLFEGKLERTDAPGEGRRFLSLERHGLDHEFAPHAVNYKANLWLLNEQGPAMVIAVHTVGAIAANVKTGDLILPDQIVDYTWGRAHTYVDTGSVQHVEFSFPYDADLRLGLLAAARAADLDLIDGGVYGCTQGPRLETAGEIDRMDRDGCSLVGMTVMPEAGLARELGLRYASVCLAVNPAAGRSDGQPINLDDLRAVSAAGMQRVGQLLRQFLESFKAF